MVNYKTVYKCRECGATSYQKVIDRAQNGALLPTGQYRCTGCRNIFADIRAWDEWLSRNDHALLATFSPPSDAPRPRQASRQSRKIDTR